MDSIIYNQEGKEAGKIELPKNVFGLPWNADLVHQVVVSMRSNARSGTAHTKTRGEVSGGGKKPWQQKGLGRARHGSIRSPIWVGGGITHGPRNDKNYDRKINRKVRVKALFTVLSKKLKEGEVIFIDQINVAEGKAKNAKSIISALAGVKGYENLATKRRNTAIVALNGKNDLTVRGLQNFSNISLNDVRNLNPVDLLNYKYVIITNPEQSVSWLSGKIGK